MPDNKKRNKKDEEEDKDEKKNEKDQRNENNKDKANEKSELSNKDNSTDKLDDKNKGNIEDGSENENESKKNNKEKRDKGKDSNTTDSNPNSKSENNNDASKKSPIAEVSSLFSQMNAMLSIVQTGYRIEAKYVTLDLGTYGPKEIKPIIMNKELEFYDCHAVGDDKRLFVSERRLPTKAWTNCDEYLDVMLNEVLPWLMRYSTVMTLEPSKKPVGLVEIYELDQSGVNTASFNENVAEYDLLSKQLISFLTPLTTGGISQLRYFSTRRVAHPVILCRLRNAFFELLQSCRIESNREFLEEYMRTRDGIRDPRYMSRLDPRIYTYPFCSPSRLCEVMASIPRSLELSYTLVHHVSVPDVVAVPISIPQLSTNLGISATRLTFTNTLMNLDYKSSMEESIFAFVSYHFAPGVVEIDIQFDDLLLKSDNACFVACMCKLLFSYSSDPRWRNISRASVENIDSIIILYMLRHRMIEPNHRNINPAHRRFSDYSPVARSKYAGRHYNNLITNKNGRGWSNAMGKFYGDGDTTIYNSCAKRQKFLADFDQPITASNITETPLGEMHPTFEAIKEIIDASDTRHPEFKKFLDTTYERFSTFIFAINNYNRLHWYTGFRLTETAMNKPETYVDVIRVIPMHWQTVPVILKSFDYTSIRERKTPYPLQFQYETTFMYDYAILSMRHILLERIVNNRLQILNEFKTNELIKLAMSGEYEQGMNPLRNFLHILSDLKILKNFKPSLRFLGDSIYKYFQCILDTTFNVDDIICSTSSSVCIDRLLKVDEIFTELTKRAEESVPYYIPMQFESGISLSPANIAALIKVRQALYFFLAHKTQCIRLNFPINYIPLKTKQPVNDEQFIKIKYQDDLTKCSFRHCVSFSQIKLYISTPSRSVVVRDRESVVASLPTRLMSGFADDTASRIMVRAEDWASELIAKSGVVNVIRMPQVAFCSILTPDVVADEVTLNVTDNVDFSFINTLS